jgi:long-chain acyl-CoA synthetase
MNVFDYLFESSKNLEKNFVIGSKEKISFKALYSKSLELSMFLKQEIGINKNILLISPNSIFFITAYLAILKSGNSCVPINYAIEQDNLDYIGKETQSSLAFISNNIQTKLNLHPNIKQINENDLNTIIQEKIYPDSFKINMAKNGSENVAEIIFTSGSTGRPKGVMISHKNIISNTNSINEYLSLTGNDRVAVVLPFFYCYGLSLLHTHLRIGGSIVLNNSFIFLGSVINDILKYKCTGFAGVPSHYQILLKKSTTFKTTNFPDLKYVTQAGGKLHDKFIKEFAQAFPNIKFYVMYGQTEATARLSYLPPNMLLKKLGSIGKEISNVNLKIINNNKEEVSAHVDGELVAKGDNVMLGYFNDIKSTNETIQDGWLYTGDIARKDEDGYIYLMARKKEIIKVGGKRVSTKEIEEVILSVAEVIDCTVEGIFDDLLGEGIEAKVILSKSIDESIIKDKILKVCSKKLSPYKIPQKFFFSTNMQMSATGKKIK